VLGVGVARTAWDRAVTVFPIAVFALAALPLAESARRATFPRVPATEQGRLGLYDTAYLEALCEERDPRPGEIAPVQRLVAATEAHPDWVVTLTYEGSDETTTERRTLRQYVRQLLRNAPSSCRLDLRAQLQAAAR
jgi:hypothetical protein